MDWCRSCLRELLEARAAADAARALQQRLEADILELQHKLQEQVQSRNGKKRQEKVERPRWELNPQLWPQERLTEAARDDADQSRARVQDTLELVEELRGEVNRLRQRALDNLQLDKLQEDGPLERRAAVRGEALADELAYVKDLLRATYNDQDAIARSPQRINIEEI